MAQRNLPQFLDAEEEISGNGYFQGFKRHLDQRFPLHWHNYLEMELVMGGTGTQTINGTSVPLKRGTFTVLRLTDYHNIVPQPRLDMYNLSFMDAMLSEKNLQILNSIKENLTFVLPEKEFSAISQFCQFCFEESTAPEPDLQYVRHLLECICTHLFRCPQFSKLPRLAEADTPMYRVLTYMHSHFRENPSLAHLATVAHYSPNYFDSVFHQKVGMTYLDYLNRLKIRYAKQLLMTTDLKSVEVAPQCGFRSFNSFLRTFKAYTGISPMEYKRAKEALRDRATDENLLT